MMLVVVVDPCAERAFDVAERATIYVESSLVVREFAVVARARLLLVKEFARVIPLTSPVRNGTVAAKEN